jgi:heat shock protein HtpX
MNQLRPVVLLGVLTVVLVAIGGSLGPGYLYGFSAPALLINIGSYFFSDRIILAMHRAERIGGENDRLISSGIGILDGHMELK